MVVYAFEQSWEILRQIILQKMPILAKKKIIFSDEAHFNLDGYVNKQTRTHIYKSRRTQNESLFGAYFGPET